MRSALWRKKKLYGIVSKVILIKKLVITKILNKKEEFSVLVKKKSKIL